MRFQTVFYKFVDTFRQNDYLYKLIICLDRKNI